MRTLLISQRVDVHPVHGERRDALDQRWAGFCAECGLLPVAVPNDAARVASLWDAVRPVGVVLSGGNDLVALGGDAPERDETEDRLLEIARAKQMPVLGVCRGLQFLVHRSGGRLASIDGHIATRHRVGGSMDRVVNSFHALGVQQLGPGWEALAASEDQFIEFARSATLNQWGVMWHPEREHPFREEDIALFKKLFRQP